MMLGGRTLGDAELLADDPVHGGRESITSRDSKLGRGAFPFQIQARFLREKEASASTGAMLGFAMMPDETMDSNREEARRKTQWRETDLRRAIAAAKKAGLRFYSVEVAPDGTISIVVGPQSPNAQTLRLKQRAGKLPIKH